jgi:hypothetical protein
MTISHMGSGSNCLVLLEITPYKDGNETVSSVADNDDALSLVGTDKRHDQGRIEIWSLVAPDVGTHDVVISFDSQLSSSAAACAATVGGVNQRTPPSTFALARSSDCWAAGINPSW